MTEKLLASNGRKRKIHATEKEKADGLQVATEVIKVGVREEWNLQIHDTSSGLPGRIRPYRILSIGRL